MQQGLERKTLISRLSSTPLTRSCLTLSPKNKLKLLLITLV